MNSKSNSRGFVLIVVLIFLIVATVIGISSIQRTILQERIAGGERERQLAFQAAELAMRDAERDILGLDYKSLLCTTCRPLDARDPYNKDQRQSNSMPAIIAGGTAMPNGGSCIRGQCMGINGDADDLSKKVNPADPNWDGYAQRVIYGTYTNAASEWSLFRTGASPASTNPIDKLRLPAYVLEYLGKSIDGPGGPARPVWRITAWGWDSSVDPTTSNPPPPTVTLQEIFVLFPNS